ncbi:ElaB/YqjD/DUF883 family membrane-anchored ribosome-binding protein [Endobacter medicaginis]|uniref:ElaB/YqjD/DUF883 family membrane-anchored ribosome-binding protein n=1 Tax=Endobacter medicaginis TaxID=1181271 RepID=A0A839UYW2_9PROT|nr:hypothetical protein [Endobacter medicaginis]MBB3173543.1 ElaB/YqjD/DUF883 family membrane-anchored ribosome-binding protein [Endobacter medicaginis]MCX5475368.1 hypothetical protein [Endobacter medicaginis]NVN30303.1 hypothetical protein [Endobacter medicaginis]
MPRSDAAKLHDLQAQLDTLSSETPDLAAIGPAVKEAVAPVGEKIEQISDRVHAQADEARAAVSDVAEKVSATFSEAVDRVSAAADASTRLVDRAVGGYRRLRDSTGLSDATLLGIVAGASATAAGVIVALTRSKPKTSTLTLPGGHQIELGPEATAAAEKLGKLSRKARKKAEARIQDAADASAAAAAEARKKLDKARRKAKKQLGQFSPADQLAALREAAAPVLNTQNLQANVKAGTDWLKDAAQKLQAMSAQLDTAPVKAQATKAAGSAKIAAQDAAGVPVALRDALVKAGWTPPKPKKSWTRVLGF